MSSGPTAAEAAAAAAAGLASVPMVDPSRKFVKLKIHSEEFYVDPRYSGLQYIASGAYGFVCAAEDSVTGRKVAIKKVKEVFRNLTDAKRILRELKLLRHLGGHENIIWILDIMVYPNQRDFKDLYIVTDLMESDLGRIIDSSQTLSDSHIKYFLYQVLRGLKYIHSAQILHRDLKPQNILVNSSCELVICDFGLARGTAVEDHGDPTLDDMGDPLEDSGAGVAANLTVYVVTRWYRAPELLLGNSAYGAPVDVWSVGCILAEVLGRKPLLRGSSHVHQLQVIVEILGTPDADQMESIKRRSAKQAIRAMGKRERIPFSKLFPRANPDAIDLLEKMLVFDPKKRITVEEALSHPYLADYHYPQDEPTAPRMVDLAFEKRGKMSKQELQLRMIREMNFFNPASDSSTGAGAAGAKESTRLSETAAKHQVTGDGVVDSTPAAAATSEARAAATSVSATTESSGTSEAAATAAASASAGAGAGSAADKPPLAGGVIGKTRDAEIAMSQTAEDDASFEKARREAQRIAQQQRSQDALDRLARRNKKAGDGAAAPAAAASGKRASSASLDSDLDGLAISDDDDAGLTPAMKRAIESQFESLEGVLMQRVTERMQHLLSPLHAKIAGLEATINDLSGKK